jgi:predicted transcriptional regulator
MEAVTLTVKQIAEEIGTTGRLLRKFLRAETVESGGKVGEDTPGKGGRYSFTREEADELIERYEAYLAPAEDEDEEVEELDEDILEEV